MRTRKVAVLSAVSLMAGLVLGATGHLGWSRLAPDRTTAAANTAATTTSSNSMLSSANLLTSTDLKSAGFSADPAFTTISDVGAQMSDSACMTAMLTHVSGGNVFSGDWDTGSNRSVQEEISVSGSDGPDPDLPNKLLAMHEKASCGDGAKVAARRDVAVGITGAQARTFTMSFDDGYNRPRIVAVIWRVGTPTRVALVTVANPSKTTDTDQIVRSAATRLLA